MRFSPLERVVTHGLRLDILCCLDGGTLTIPQVSARIGQGEKHVAHHMKVLDSLELVGQEGETEGGQPLYATRIKEHPTWVVRAVSEHRLVERPEQ